MPNCAGTIAPGALTVRPVVLHPALADKQPIKIASLSGIFDPWQRESLNQIELR
jgi:hypothetical protein